MNKNLGFVSRNTTIWQRISVNVTLSCIYEVSSVTDMAECSILTENFPGYKYGNRVYVYYTIESTPNQIPGFTVNILALLANQNQHIGLESSALSSSNDLRTRIVSSEQNACGSFWTNNRLTVLSMNSVDEFSGFTDSVTTHQDFEETKGSR